MQLNRDFSEFVRSCNRNEVRYLVVGGYAVAAHGYPRTTKDFDVWVWIGSDNPNRVIAALRDFGFGEVGLTSTDFSQSGKMIQLGYPPIRIDLLTSIDGVDFEEAYVSRMTIRIDEQDVSFIGREALIKNKLASGRLQDLADVEFLNKN